MVGCGLAGIAGWMGLRRRENPHEMGILG